MDKANQSFFLLTHWVRRIENVATATKSYSPDFQIGEGENNENRPEGTE